MKGLEAGPGQPEGKAKGKARVTNLGFGKGQRKGPSSGGTLAYRSNKGKSKCKGGSRVKGGGIRNWAG